MVTATGRIKLGKWTVGGATGINRKKSKSKTHADRKTKRSNSLGMGIHMSKTCKVCKNHGKNNKTKHYRNRRSPHHSASAHAGKKMKGVSPEGKPCYYISKPDKNGRYRWVAVKKQNRTASKGKKRTASKGKKRTSSKGKK